MIDSHCHIAGPEFAQDLDQVVDRARTAGVTGALVILAADDDPELRQAAAVSSHWSEVRFSIGVHPHAAGSSPQIPRRPPGRCSRPSRRSRWRAPWARSGSIITTTSLRRDVQQQVFRAQIRLAQRLERPIVIHTREADDDTFRILDEERAQDVGGVFHCFTGDRDMARRALDIGFHLSLAGIVTFPRALELKEVAKHGSPGPPADRDRQPVSGACSPSRHA